MHGRVHLYVEHSLCAPECVPNLNPLIEYPLDYVDPHGAADVEEGSGNVEEVAVEVEEVVVEVEDDVTEVEEVEVDKVGPDVESGFVGPDMVSGIADVDTEVNEVGTTEREETNVEGTTENNEVIDDGPTHVPIGGVNENLSRKENEVNGLAGSDCEAAEKEDSALDIHFGDSEEEIEQEDNFGYEVGASYHHQFEDGVNLGEDVFVGGAATTETEPPTDIVSEAGQSKEKDKAGSSGKGKGVTGSNPKRKRGRPAKKKQVETEAVFDDEVLQELLNNGDNGQCSRTCKDRGLSDNEEYESDVLDSGCESEDEDELPKKKFSTFKLPDSMYDYEWEIGTFFLSKEDFKYACRTYAVHYGRAIKFLKNDKTRVRVICKGNKGRCEWQAYCAKIPDEETWQLRKVTKHNCSREFKIRMMNSKWLGPKLHNRVKENPSLKLNSIIERAQTKWGINVGPSKAYRARSIAIDMVDGSFREQYTRIYDYCHELLRCNPHSTVRVSTQPFQGTEVALETHGAVMCPHFQRMYICFKACKDSFFECRPIIGLDGCFLKGYYGGQLLSAIGRDPNDQMMPIAFAVVEGETKESWAWFLDLLVKDLGGVRLCKTYTFISDQQKVNT